MIKRNLSKNILKSLKFYLFNCFLFVIFSLILAIPYFGEVNFLFLDKLHGDIKPREEIVIIGIDDKSLSEIGAWPWDRSVFAKAIADLEEAEAKVVGIDVLLLEGRKGDEELADQLKGVDAPVVLASKLIDDEVLESKFQGENIANGYINFDPDRDGKIRKTTITRQIEGGCLSSFAFMVVKEFLGVKEVEGCKEEIELHKDLTYQNVLHLNYSSSEFQKISFVDFYSGKVEKEDLRNKVVLIGSTALDLKSNLSDNFTSVSGEAIPGVEIHANIVNSFLENRFQKNLSLYIFYPLIVIISSILLFLYRKIKNNKIELVLYLISLLLFNIIGITLFDFGVNWPFLQGSILLTVSYVYMIAYKYLVEQAENRFVKKAFSQYINPKLLKQLVEEPENLKLGGEKKIMTVLFSDIRGFTSISEKLTPEDLIHLLNEFLDLMCEVILANKGTIDKFIGDAVMAFWNAPLEDENHRLNAVKTALQMTRRLDEFNKELKANLCIGIGINTGEVIVGNIGSRKRFDYTILGDNVNLGSRAEGLTKKYGVNIIVTESVIRGISKKVDKVIFRLLDEVIVKGRRKSVRIYEVMRKSERNKRIKQMYQKSFELYQKGRFKDAMKLFKALKNDGPSLMMVERIRSIKDKRGWEGVWIWEEK